MSFNYNLGTNQGQGQTGQQPLNAQAQNFAMRGSTNTNLMNQNPAYGIINPLAAAASNNNPNGNFAGMGNNTQAALFNSPQFQQLALARQSSPQLQSSPLLSSPLPPQSIIRPQMLQNQSQSQSQPQSQIQSAQPQARRVSSDVIPSNENIMKCLKVFPPQVQQTLRSSSNGSPALLWALMTKWMNSTAEGQALSTRLGWRRRSSSDASSSQSQTTSVAPMNLQQQRPPNSSSQLQTQQGGANQVPGPYQAQQQPLRPMSQLDPAHHEALQALQQRASGAIPISQLQQAQASALANSTSGFAPSLLGARGSIGSGTGSQAIRPGQIPISQAFTPSTGVGLGYGGSSQINRLAVRPQQGGSSGPYQARATSPARNRADEREAIPDVRRRKDEGMRGTMRNEIARLMYGAGDVAEPHIDTVDLMEDLVVDFLADLCRPTPPIRINKSAAHQTVPLSAQIIRHRLSRPSMRKYLDRFDTMQYMSGELARNKRVLEPTNSDLAEVVGRDYLGIDSSNQTIGEIRKKGRPKRTKDDDPAGTGSGAQGDGEREKKKIGRPKKTDSVGHSRHGSFSLPQSGRTSMGPPGELETMQRKKPGPKRGWKKDAMSRKSDTVERDFGVKPES